MASLDTTDGEILMLLLRDGPLDSGDISNGIETGRSEIRARLTRLQDDGLVAEDTERTFSLTADGQRVLKATATGTVDDRIDTSPDVERELESLDLAPDEEAAVRSAYVFLKYWGDATAGEIADAIYSEHPAGYDSADAWWRECVRNRLTSLSSISPPDGGLVWQYTGETGREHIQDGRHIAGPTAVGSARHAIEHVELTESERTAVRAAFDVIFEAGTISDAELVEAVYSDYSAGYETAERWWRDCVSGALATLPNVQSDSAGETWRYEQQRSS